MQQRSEQKPLFAHVFSVINNLLYPSIGPFDTPFAASNVSEYGRTLCYPFQPLFVMTYSSLLSTQSTHWDHLEPPFGQQFELFSVWLFSSSQFFPSIFPGSDFWTNGWTKRGFKKPRPRQVIKPYIMSAKVRQKMRGSQKSWRVEGDFVNDP